MKALLVSSIAALSILSGSIFVVNGNIQETTQPNSYIEYSEIKPVVEQITQTITVEPIYIPETSTVDIISPTVEQKVIPTFDEMLLKYIAIRDGNELSGFLRRLQSIYPDKFSPDNIESSFEYINNFFNKGDTTEYDWRHDVFPMLIETFHW